MVDMCAGYMAGLRSVVNDGDVEKAAKTQPKLPTDPPHYPNATLKPSVSIRDAARTSLPPPTPTSPAVKPAATLSVYAQPNPVEDMLKLEHELSNLSSQLGLAPLSSSNLTSTIQSSFIARASQTSLASSFAAAAALDGSFCVVPSNDIIPTFLGPMSPNLANRAIEPSPTLRASPRQFVNPNHQQQVQRLLNSMKTLSDENAKLLAEVESMRTALAEAAATRQRMEKFKREYEQRFASMKHALEKFRQAYPSKENPAKDAGNFEVERLREELRAEREESAKKDSALRKYEAFYREVKARSARKSAAAARGTGSLRGRGGSVR